VRLRGTLAANGGEPFSLSLSLSLPLSLSLSRARVPPATSMRPAQSLLPRCWLTSRRSHRAHIRGLPPAPARRPFPTPAS
jgi:hypothetical protein